MDTAMVYEESTGDGTRFVYRASSLGQCLNALACARRGITPASVPAELQARFDLGTELEPIILDRLQTKHGFHLYGQQSVVEMGVGTKAIIRGHVDALCAEKFQITHYMGNPATGNEELPDHEVVVVDAKSAAPSGIEKWEKESWQAYPHYAYQQSFYTLVPGYAGVVMAFFDKLTGKMLVDYWPADSLPITKADIIRRVMTVENMARNPDKVFAEPCPKENRYGCGYWRHHPQLEPGQVKGEKLEGVDLDELAELGRMHEDARQRESAAKAEKDELSERIATAFGHQPASVKLTSQTITTFHTVSSVTQWSEIAKAVGMDDAEAAKAKFSTQRTASKLTVKVTPKKEKD
jgi:hypothetical protein